MAFKSIPFTSEFAPLFFAHCLFPVWLVDGSVLEGDITFDFISQLEPYYASVDQVQGRMFRERKETMVLFPGVAPVYKPGILGTGQYPQSDYGYTDPNRATAYCQYSVFPDYERYTLQQHESYDKLYELKVNPNGSTIFPLVRTAKWKILGVTPIHGDFGRVEYFELGLEKSNAD